MKNKFSNVTAVTKFYFPSVIGLFPNHPDVIYALFRNKPHAGLSREGALFSKFFNEHWEDKLVKTYILPRSLRSFLFLSLTIILCCVFLNTPISAQGDEILPPSKHVLPSTIQVNLTKHFARLPLRRGSYNDEQTRRNVWFILTDVSDPQIATQIGLNFAPKLANAPVGCPGCVQVLNVPANITLAQNVKFRGNPDFSPQRVLVPGPTEFPFLTGQAGAKGDFFTRPMFSRLERTSFITERLSPSATRRST